MLAVVVDEVGGVEQRPDDEKEALARLGIHDGGFVEDDISAVVAILPDKTVTGRNHRSHKACRIVQCQI